VIEQGRTANKSEHSSNVDEALNRDTTGVFRTRLSEACRSVFLYGSPATINRTTLQVPNWIISKDGFCMHPTTWDVQAVYYNWFRSFDTSKHNDDDKSLLDCLATIAESFTNGERGNAFERLLTSKLTMIPDFQLRYRLLRYNFFNQFAPVSFKFD
jgi:hypothetical protein